MLGITQSAALVGVDAHPVQVEVNTGEAGELKFILVGLPDAAVKESQDRVFSAMANSGFRTPATRTTINLAPGGLRKEGPRIRPTHCARHPCFDEKVRRRRVR
jgi:magnesium chelatase family protein